MDANAPSAGLPILTLREFFCRSYAPYAALELEASTLRHYVTALVRIVDAMGDEPVIAIPTARIVEYGMAMLRAGKRPATVRQNLVPLKALLRLAEDLELPVIRPRFRALKLRQQDTLPKAWTRDEVMRLLDACRRVTPQILELVGFMIHTGLRTGEAFGLQWESVRLDMAPPSVMLTRTKTKKSRRVLLSPAALAYLPPRGDGPYVFTVMETGSRWAAPSTRLFKRALRAAKLDMRASYGWARHTFASHFLLKRPSMFLLSRQLGNSAEVCDRFYSHFVSETAAESYNVVQFEARPL